MVTTNHTPSRGSRARVTLDVVATIVMTAAAGMMLYAMVRRPPAAPQPPARPEPPAVVLPTEPVSLDGSASIGSASAPIVAIVVSDFQCPFCRRFATETWPEFRKRWVDTGEVRVIFRHLPLSSIHPRAVRAAHAAECAGAQGKFWEMHDALFSGPGAMAEEDILRSSAQVLPNVTAFRKCLEAESSARISADVAFANSLRIASTPTFLFGTAESGNRVRLRETLRGAGPIERFADVIGIFRGGAT